MSPPSPTRSARAWDLASLAALAVVLALVLATFRDYGITWDETWHLEYGDTILAWFRSGFTDRAALSHRDYLYGGAFDLLGAIARALSPLDAYATIHLVGALLGVVGLAATGVLARQLGGPAAGFAAIVLLASDPSYYGHMYNNPKDLPFAVGSTWSVCALVALAARPGQWSTGLCVRAAIAFGAAMSVRVGGLLCLCYLVALLGMVGLERWWRTGNLTAAVRAATAPWRRAAAIAGGTWLLMLVPWPWAWMDPIRRPFYALGRMSNFQLHVRTMPFAGEPIETTEVPWNYLVNYFGLKLPLHVLALVGAAIVLAAVALRRLDVRRDDLATPRRWALVALALLFPPLYAVVVHAPLYDGLRHFLFLLPLVYAIAGVTLVVLVRRAWSAGRRVIALALVLAAGLGTARTIAELVRLHPHEYIYFNELTGGLPGAYGNYDTDYYGNSYKEAFARMNATIWQRDGDAFLDRVYVISGCIMPHIAKEYLLPNYVWKEKGKGDPPEFYLGYTRGDCHMHHEGAPEIARVEREGVLLNVIRELYDREGPDAPAPATKRPRARPPAARPSP